MFERLRCGQIIRVSSITSGDILEKIVNSRIKTTFQLLHQPGRPRPLRKTRKSVFQRPVVLLMDLVWSWKVRFMTSTSPASFNLWFGSGSQNKAPIVLWQVKIIVFQVMLPEVKTPNNKTTNCLVNLYVNSLTIKKTFHINLIFAN